MGPFKKESLVFEVLLGLPCSGRPRIRLLSRFASEYVRGLRPADHLPGTSVKVVNRLRNLPRLTLPRGRSTESVLGGLGVFRPSSRPGNTDWGDVRTGTPPCHPTPGPGRVRRTTSTGQGRPSRHARRSCLDPVRPGPTHPPVRAPGGGRWSLSTDQALRPVSSMSSEGPTTLYRHQ